MSRPASKALTINEAATATGWSPRMLRYVEQLGLVTSPRSASGYRLYGPAQLQRLRSLRALLDEHSLELGDVAVALRLRRERELAAALDDWFEAAATPEPAATTPDSDWLAFEQSKHLHLLTPRRTDSA
jgi:DNA-binding transcriptional MerR regulator